MERSEGGVWGIEGGRWNVEDGIWNNNELEINRNSLRVICGNCFMSLTKKSRRASYLK